MPGAGLIAMMTTTSTNPGNVRKWVAALRSGDYKQGRSALRTVRSSGDSFCCLGVACEAAIRDGVAVPYAMTEGSGHGYYGMAGTAGALPEEVRDWLGIGDHANIVWGSGDTPDAITANDLSHWTFDEIADAIERHFGLTAVPV